MNSSSLSKYCGDVFSAVDATSRRVLTRQTCERLVRSGILLSTEHDIIRIGDVLDSISKECLC